MIRPKKLVGDEVTLAYIEYLEGETDNGTGKLCPKCKTTRMINLTTVDDGIRLCGCGYQEPFKLKKGQKSVLIDGAVGE